jgi:hypothetical protein
MFPAQHWNMKMRLLGIVVILAIVAPAEPAAARKGWSLPLLNRLFKPKPPPSCSSVGRAGGVKKARWTDRQRHCRRLNTAAERRYCISNVRWGFNAGKGGVRRGVFKTTTVDPAQVEDVELVIQHFKPEWFASHALLRFKLKKGSSVMAADGSRAPDLVFSQEADVKSHQRYSHVDGLFGKFNAVIQLGTWQDFRDRPTSPRWTRFSTYHLNLTPEQKQALFKSALDLAVKPRPNEKYNTLYNNCSTNVVYLINSVMPRRQRVFRLNPLQVCPAWTPRLLAGKGLIDRSSRQILWHP